MAEFIFMLTRNDQTVGNCLEVIELISQVGVRHIGFKDVGVDPQTMGTLTQEIHRIGALAYLEVVETDLKKNIDAANVALDIGVDRLLGGVDAENILETLGDSDIEYFPFPGQPIGHPTKLGGSPAQVANDCRRFERLGCAGVDLLAYRAFDAQALDLIRAARSVLSGQLIVAGDVDSPKRIHELSAAGADAFTIGSAIFDGAFISGNCDIVPQLQGVLLACGH